ncbi:hypothetical protein LSAT2_021455 [Lamellibrachia satsuma]|nr:hypothetical protein LSAT2_021455 [Lamellibrachia satsuma]
MRARFFVKNARKEWGTFVSTSPAQVRWTPRRRALTDGHRRHGIPRHGQSTRVVSAHLRRPAGETDASTGPRDNPRVQLLHGSPPTLTPWHGAGSSR